MKIPHLKGEKKTRRTRLLCLTLIISAVLLFSLSSSGNRLRQARENEQQFHHASDDKEAPLTTIHVADNFTASIYSVTANADCPSQPSSFLPLTSFQFWGKEMNTSSPCPTAGLNNQLVMVMALIYCFTQQKNDAVFRFKDITCSPTGGREGGKRSFRVGSDDYEYKWFRWSELFRVSPPAAGKSICLADNHTWSEHLWMKRCPTFVDAIYGSDMFWTLRRSLTLHHWFDRLVSDFVLQHVDDEQTNRRIAAHEQEILPPFMAIHVRRGDYENFCKQTSKSSGVKKFRTAPFVWLQKASLATLQRHGLDERPATLSSKFMHSCFPPDAKIVKDIVALAEKFPHIRILVVATNSPLFLSFLRQELSASTSAPAKALKVINFGEFLRAEQEKGVGAVYSDYWGRQSGTEGAVVTDTEASMLDVNVLSHASVVVLNRYSTFSESAIDFRMTRNRNLSNLQLYWW